MLYIIWNKHKRLQYKSSSWVAHLFGMIWWYETCFPIPRYLITSCGVRSSLSARIAAVTRLNTPSVQQGRVISKRTLNLMATSIETIEFWITKQKNPSLCLHECVPPPCGGGTHSWNSVLGTSCMPICHRSSSVTLWACCHPGPTASINHNVSFTRGNFLWPKLTFSQATPGATPGWANESWPRHDQLTSSPWQAIGMKIVQTSWPSWPSWLFIIVAPFGVSRSWVESHIQWSNLHHLAYLHQRGTCTRPHRGQCIPSKSNRYLSLTMKLRLLWTEGSNKLFKT